MYNPNSLSEALGPATQKDYTVVLLGLYIYVWIYTYIYTYTEDIQLRSPKKLYWGD